MNPQSSPDWLEQAFRDARGAIPDAGFSLRVEQRVRREKRRRLVLRHLPKLMGALGVFVASLFTGGLLVALQNAQHLLMASLFARMSEVFSLVRGLSSYGLQPWMVCTGLAAASVMAFCNARERQLAGQF